MIASEGRVPSIRHCTCLSYNDAPPANSLQTKDVDAVVRRCKNGALGEERNLLLVLMGCCCCCVWLDNVPNVLGGVAELAAGYAGAEAVVADADGVVLVLVGEAVLAFGHGTDEDADALLRSKVGDVVSNSNNGRVEGESHFAAVGWKMVSDWILDDLEKLFLRSSRADAKVVKKLDHEAGEAFEGTRYPNSG